MQQRTKFHVISEIGMMNNVKTALTTFVDVKFLDQTSHLSSESLYFSMPSRRRRDVFRHLQSCRGIVSLTTEGEYMEDETGHDNPKDRPNHDDRPSRKKRPYHPYPVSERELREQNENREASHAASLENYYQN